MLASHLILTTPKDVRSRGLGTDCRMEGEELASRSSESSPYKDE